MPERVSDAEYDVLEVLWAEAPLSATDVAARLVGRKDWSESTVKTLLGRLAAKGVLTHRPDGRRYLYRPAVSRADYVRAESRRLVDRLFGGRVSPLVAHLAAQEDLSAAEIAEIKALIEELGNADS